MPRTWGTRPSERGCPFRGKGRTVPREEGHPSLVHGVPRPLGKGVRGPRRRGIYTVPREGHPTVRKGNPSFVKGVPILRKRGTRPSVYGLPFLGNVVAIARNRGSRPSKKDVPVSRIKGNQSQGQWNASLGKGVPDASETGYLPLG